MGAQNTKVVEQSSVLTALATPLVATHKRKADNLGYTPGSLSSVPLPTAPSWLDDSTQSGDSKRPIKIQVKPSVDPNPELEDSKTPMDQLRLSKYPYLQIGQLCSHQNKNGYRYLADILAIDEKTMSVQLRYSRVTNDAQSFWVQLPDKSVAPASYKTTTNTVYSDRDNAARESMAQQGIQCVCDPGFQCHCLLKLDV